MYEFFQVIDASHDDPTLYPPLSGPGEALPFEWEPADGSNPSGFVTKAVDVMQYTGAGWSKIRGLKDLDFHVVITDARVVVYCEKFTKGGGWWGFGAGGIAIALVANAVSHARAAARRKGKIFIGQVRYSWLRQVVVLTDKRGRLWGVRLVVDAGGAGESRMIAMDLAIKERFDPAGFARHITMSAAGYLLESGLVDANDTEVNSLATAPDSSARSWNLPAPVQVGGAGSLPGSTRPAILPPAPVAAAEPAPSTAPAVGAVTEPATATEPAAGTEPVAAATPPATGESSCAVCGATLRAGTAACGRCGAVRRVPSVSAPAAVPAPVADVAATTNRALLRSQAAVADAAEQAAASVAPATTSVASATTSVASAAASAASAATSLPPAPPTPPPTGTPSAPLPPAPPPPAAPWGPPAGGGWSGGRTAPPEVWVVACALVLVGGLLLYPFLDHGFTFLGHIADSNGFVRAFAALFLFALVLVGGVGLALIALAVGVVRGSRVAQLLTGLVSSLVGLGELIEATSNDRNAFGSPGVSHGAAVVAVVVCVVIVLLLFAMPNARAFFAEDDRPLGVHLGAAVAVYFGAVLILDGMLLMICGAVGTKFVWWGVVLAASGALLVGASRPLLAGRNYARVAVTIALAAAVTLMFVVDNSGRGAALSFVTLVPLGLGIAALVGLWMPLSSNEHFRQPRTTLSPSPVFMIAWVVVLVLCVLLAGVGFNAASHPASFDVGATDNSPQPQYTPAYQPVPSYTSAGISASDARSAVSSALDQLVSSGSSATSCSGNSIGPDRAASYTIDDVSPSTGGSFSVSATVTLSDGGTEVVTYVVDGGTSSGDACIESADVGTETSPTPQEPADVPSVPASGDPVPSGASLPGAPSGAVVAYTDDGTTPTSSDQLVEWQPASGLDDSETAAVQDIIGFMVGINQQNFQNAWDLSTEHLGASSPSATFQRGYATTRFYQVAFGQPQELADDLIAVPARFVSRQDPAAQGNPDGVTSCSYWPQYVFVVAKSGGDWLVDVASAYGSRPELAALKRLGSDGHAVVNPVSQRVDCS